MIHLSPVFFCKDDTYEQKIPVAPQRAAIKRTFPREKDSPGREEVASEGAPIAQWGFHLVHSSSLQKSLSPTTSPAPHFPLQLRSAWHNKACGNPLSSSVVVKPFQLYHHPLLLKFLLTNALLPRHPGPSIAPAQLQWF